MTSARFNGCFAAFLALAVLSISAQNLCADSVQEAQRLLDEKGNQILDNDLKVIGEATELTDLDLSHCGRISDKGLAHLTGLTKLRTMSLMGCHYCLVVERWRRADTVRTRDSRQCNLQILGSTIYE